jgi:hypothetical protein
MEKIAEKISEQEIATQGDSAYAKQCRNSIKKHITKHSVGHVCFMCAIPLMIAKTKAATDTTNNQNKVGTTPTAGQTSSNELTKTK